MGGTVYDRDTIMKKYMGGYDGKPQAITACDADSHAQYHPPCFWRCTAFLAIVCQAQVLFALGLLLVIVQGNILTCFHCTHLVLLQVVKPSSLTRDTVDICAHDPVLACVSGCTVAHKSVHVQQSRAVMARSLSYEAPFGRACATWCSCILFSKIVFVTAVGKLPIQCSCQNECHVTQLQMTMKMMMMKKLRYQAQHRRHKQLFRTLSAS